jgi:diadenosine tetraphosphate (Ap4A) HIT family hydrolase
LSFQVPYPGVKRKVETTMSSIPKQCDDSQLCAELNGETEGIAFHALYQGHPESRIVTQGDNFALVADISPLGIGHTLLVPRNHYINFGTIPEELADELDSFRGHCLSLISDHYGPATVLEHGSSSNMRRSACISHAHWHLIPGLKSPIQIFERDGLRGFDVCTWRELGGFAELDQPYFYYNFGSEHRIYSTNLSMPHQYLRIVMAEILGIPEPEWDWALSLRPELLQATVQELRGVRVHE